MSTIARSRRASRTNPFRDLVDAFRFHRTRSGLADLSDHLLEDIGVTRRQALEEARRPFWSLPAWWRS